MKGLKYTLFLFLFAFSIVQAQEFRFKSTALSIMQRKNAKEWGKWSTPKPTEVIISLDFDKDKIVIYSTEIQHYRIIEALGTEHTDKDVITSYICKNIEGIVVKLSFFIRKDLDNKTQLYLYHKNFAFCYDIVEITE